LRSKGIGASVHFIPIPLHPFFAAHAGRPMNECPEALAQYPRLVSLPLFPGITDEEIDYVSKTVIEVLQSARRRILIATGGTAR
jgi:dTDP-4-amino-4,6-dideoxygalactose transaminase